MLKPKLYSAECIKKLEKPVLTKDDIPYEASLIFNAGVAKYKGKYIVYSLGNFCFGGNSNPSDKDTMIFQQTFTMTKDDKMQTKYDVEK